MDIILQDTNQTFAFNEIYSDKNSQFLLAYKYKELVTSIISLQKNETNDILHNIKNYLNFMDFLTVKNLFDNFFNTNLKNKYNDKLSCCDLMKLNQPNELTNKVQLFHWYDDIIDMHFDHIKEKSPNTKNLVVEKTKNYINKNYMNNISLDDIANHVYLNPSYLSRYFKLHTGNNLIEYLIEIRMESALKLIKAHKYKIYEISEMCGYRSSRYFSKTFKRYMGYTPTEYLHICDDELL